MRILVSMPYADGAGHYGKHTAKTCQTLASLGHEVVVCSNVDNFQQYLPEKPAFRVIALGSRYSFWRYEEWKNSFMLYWLMGRMRNNIAVLRLASRQAKQKPFDVFYPLSYELVSTWLLHLSRQITAFPPVAMGLDGLNFTQEKYYGGQFQVLWRRLQKIAARGLVRGWIDALMVIYEPQIASLRNQLGLKNDFVVNALGDVREPSDHTLDKDFARKRIGLEGYQGIVFLFFGTIRPDKDLGTLLRAIPLMKEKEFRLVIAGMPLRVDMSAFEGMLDDPRILSRFDYVPEDMIDPYFYACDAQVLSYAKVYAGSAGALQEAFGRGVPVIASDVAENGTVVAKENVGIVVQAEDPAALAEAMDRFIRTSPEERSVWSKNEMAMVSTNSREVLGQRIIETFESAIKQKAIQI